MVFALNFLPKNYKSYFIPNPSDKSMETLNNYKNDCSNDVFFALSHGVHRGKLKMRSTDDRETFIKNLINKCKNIKFDIGDGAKPWSNDSVMRGPLVSTENDFKAKTTLESGIRKYLKWLKINA